MVTMRNHTILTAMMRRLIDMYEIFVIATLIFLIIGLGYYTGLLIKEYIIDYIRYGEEEEDGYSD